MAKKDVTALLDSAVKKYKETKEGAGAEPDKAALVKIRSAHKQLKRIQREIKLGKASQKKKDDQEANRQKKQGGGKKSKSDSSS